MRILVTGGLGFIGMALSRRLISCGHDVVCLDSLTPQIHGDVPAIVVPAGVRIIRGDIRQLVRLTEQEAGFDIVFHLAAETGTGQSMYRIADYVDVNEGGTAALLEAISRWNIKPSKVILASSRSVYGEGAYIDLARPDILIQPEARTKGQLDKGVWEFQSASDRQLQAVPTPETLPFAPGSVYAATKASQELLLRSAGHAMGFKPVIFRFQNVYGEGQSLQNPYTGIISIFYNRARQGLEIPIYEDGLESRDFIHVDDIVTALVSSIDADLPPAAILNLGSGIPTSVRHLAETLLAVAEFNVPLNVTGQFRVGDIRHCYADMSLARELLGFEPKISLHDGLASFASWASGQPTHIDKSEQATQELRAKGLTN